MPSNTQSKLAEDQFMSRLQDNLMALPGIGVLEKGDRIAELRKLTNGQMLRAELEATFPLGRSLSEQVGRLKTGLFAKAADPVTLAGRVVLHLECLVETDADDEPISLMELNLLLNGEKEMVQRYQRVCVLGLFSPTGWSEDAKTFIANDPPGSGWASEHVHPILIGPQVTALQWDHHNERVQPYIETFCGLTLQERKKVCHDRLERAILVQEFAGLHTIAEEMGFSQDFVREVARDMASEDQRLTVKKVSGVGWVVKKRI
jgi:hypothetical protein